jgi:FtsH-binding integral membrane protein
LFFALWGLILVGFIQIFLPFNRTFNLIVAVGSAVIFSGYIVYDTYNIMNRLSPEEYIIASVELYLDLVNLFLAILRILNNSSDN